MSYFDAPRLHFSGSFRASPSTINNTPSNFGGPPLDPLWNAKGSHDFQLLRGDEFTILPGASVQPCTIKTILDASGATITNAAIDPLIGRFVISTNTPSNGKLVDLDPDQQQVSQIWGMQLGIGDPSGDWLTADYDPAYFQQIFTRRAPGGFAIGFGAAYQSLLSNLQWPENPTSPLLRFWKASSPDVLSIRFNVDRLDAKPTLSNGGPNPNFTLGRISGTIGPATNSEPVHVTIGRMLRPAPQTTAAAVEAKPGISKERLGVAVAAQPAAAAGPIPVNYAPARVDTTRNVVGIDLGNALPFNADGTPRPAGTLQAAIRTSTGMIDLGTIDNSLANYLDRAFLFELPLSSDAATAIRSNPIVVTRDGAVILTENPAGTWIDADEHVYRMDASTTAIATLYATQFGQPVSGQNVGFALSFLGDPSTAQQPISVSPQTVTLNGGTATFTISSGSPGNPRGPIDGQVYAIGFNWSANTMPDRSATVSVHVYDAVDALSTPQWSDVAPIFGQIMFLYPFMQTILDLSDEQTVNANAAIIARFMRLPMTDPHYMPVTRDLSGPKTKMLLAYLDAQTGGTP